jgi:ATP-dependent helicase Lhr and Lhr-like helicase
MITIRAGTDEIGQVDASFLLAIDSDAQRGAFMLAGRSWQIVTIDWERGIGIVKPAQVGRAPRWNGGAQFLSYDLCQSMKRLLCCDDQDPAWSKRTCTVMETLRAEFEFLRDGVMLRQSSDEIRWWTFAGGAANLLLARMLGSELGDKVSSRDNCITLKDDAAKSLVAVQESIRSMAERQGPSLEDARRHANGGTAKARFSKFDVCLPEVQLETLLIEGVLDVEGAQRAVAEVLGSPEEPVGVPDRIRPHT